MGISREYRSAPLHGPCADHSVSPRVRATTLRFMERTVTLLPLTRRPCRRHRGGPARRGPGRKPPPRARASTRASWSGGSASRASWVRSALARLEREGLLVHSLHRGLEVVRLSVDDVRDLYATRRTLEVAGLEAMVRRRPADDVWLQAAVV